jgi:excisionase family DNA binding protein
MIEPGPKPEERFLSPRQLASRWSFHEESVRRMIRSRRIPAVRIGKRLRVPGDQVEAFEQAHSLLPHGSIARAKEAAQ